MAIALLLLMGQFATVLFPESPTTEADLAMQEQVERLLERRIDLNRASAQQLLAIPWLSPVLACSIISVRDSLGGFRQVAQLEQVPGMTAVTFEAIRPFLRVGGAQRALSAGATCRTGIDSIGADLVGIRMLNRLELQHGLARVSILAEKDKGEASACDFVSAGAELSRGRMRVVLGDFTAGFGQGLVFSSPHWRSSIVHDADRGDRIVRLVGSAVEASYLRGGTMEVTRGDWSAWVLGSYAGRDARLNDHGTVERLVGSGVHDDSASIAGHGAVREFTAGIGTSYSANRTRLGFVAGYSLYNRTFVPTDSAGSFVGRDLSAAGMNAEYQLGQCRFRADVALSSGPGLSGAFEMIGGWPDLDARISLRGRQARFFAPHGRWSNLTGTRDRLDAAGRLMWHRGGTSVSAGGNTYRDFELDSVPARLELRVGQELGKLDMAFTLGSRYQAEQERSRTARVEVGVSLTHGTNARLVLADVYPEKTTSRGTSVVCLGAQRLGSTELSIAVARVAVSGKGITMYVPEPGAGGIGASFSSSVSSWRVSAGCRSAVLRWLRLGLKIGCAWRPQPVFDATAQLDVAES